MTRRYAEIKSMTRRCAEIKNGYSTYIYWGIIPHCNFQYRNRVRSTTLKPLEIISRAEINNSRSTCIFGGINPVVIFLIEIVSTL